ncbi:MAG: hypothetical protein MJ050_05085 [Phascolarctobacterium sp.]|nr:hypothetical protein [Phascolarctobacterium sp.]
MLTAEELLANRQKAEADFVTYFKGSYKAIDRWIREYDRWYREDEGNAERIGFYGLVDRSFVTPSEAGVVEYDSLGKVKAVKIETLMCEGKPMANCQEGTYDGLEFVGEGESFNIPFNRCFPIFVEMLEAYDNLMRT